MNHDVYASSQVIVADMQGILRGERPPEQRTKEFEALVSAPIGGYGRRLRQIGEVKLRPILEALHE